MKMILVAAVIGLAACGGTEQTAAPFYEGTWTVQLGADAAGTITLHEKAGTAHPQQFEGAWDLGSLGSGDVVGNVREFGPDADSTIDLLFVKSDHFIGIDASAKVTGSEMSGTGTFLPAPPGQTVTFAASLLR